MLIWKARRFLTMGGMLIGGVADPPAARAAAPRLYLNLCRKKEPDPPGRSHHCRGHRALVSEMLPDPKVDWIRSIGHKVHSVRFLAPLRSAPVLLRSHHALIFQTVPG
jgi:hypothetical protein